MSGTKPTKWQKRQRGLKPRPRTCLECDKPFTAIGPVNRLCANCRGIDRPVMMAVSGRSRPMEQVPMLGGYLESSRAARFLLGQSGPDGEVTAANVVGDWRRQQAGTKHQTHQQATGHRAARAVEVPGQLAADERTYRAALESRIAAGDREAAAEYYARYAARLVVYRGQPVG